MSNEEIEEYIHQMIEVDADCQYEGKTGRKTQPIVQDRSTTDVCCALRRSTRLLERTLVGENLKTWDGLINTLLVVDDRSKLSFLYTRQLPQLDHSLVCEAASRTNIMRWQFAWSARDSDRYREHMRKKALQWVQSQWPDVFVLAIEARWVPRRVYRFWTASLSIYCFF